MSDFYVAVGDRASFSKTVGETDVYAFAGITGDFSPNHINKAYMERSSFGRLQAHGALLVGFMSTASTLVIAKSREGADETPVSLGYDRVRFLAPVYFGDTVDGRIHDRVDRSRAAALQWRHQSHQPGRHAGRGGDPYPQVGRQPVSSSRLRPPPAEMRT